MGQIKAMAVRIADWLWEHEATGPAGHIEGTAVATRRIKTRKIENQIPRSAAFPCEAPGCLNLWGRFVNYRSRNDLLSPVVRPPSDQLSDHPHLPAHTPEDVGEHSRQVGLKMHPGRDWTARPFGVNWCSSGARMNGSTAVWRRGRGSFRSSGGIQRATSTAFTRRRAT